MKLMTHDILLRFRILERFSSRSSLRLISRTEQLQNEGDKWPPPNALICNFWTFSSEFLHPFMLWRLDTRGILYSLLC
jgi:hypothetical protein